MRIIVLAACASILAGCASDGPAQSSSGTCFLWPFCDGGDSSAPSGQPAAAGAPSAPATPASASVGTASSASTGSSGGSFFGLFGGSADTTADAPQLGVNAYLWRATLDTLTFMPLSSADPVGGVIITEWYSAPENPNERMKLTAYILDRRLRADALKVAVFRQTRTAEGWVDAQTNPDTAVKIENAILTRARQLHLASTE